MNTFKVDVAKLANGKKLRAELQRAALTDTRIAVPVISVRKEQSSGVVRWSSLVITLRATTYSEVDLEKTRGAIREVLKSKFGLDPAQWRFEVLGMTKEAYQQAKKVLEPNQEPKLKTEHNVVALTQEELALIVEALDSHVYWQLSDKGYRDSGNVMEPGSDDPETAAEIKRAELLHDRLDFLVVRKD